MTHEFLYLPECPIPLLGRDLLTKLRAQITFNQGGPANLTMRGPNTLIMAVTMPTGDEWQLYLHEKGDLVKPICLLEEFPNVWTENWAQPGSLSFACSGRTQAQGSPCQTEAVSSTMGSSLGIQTRPQRVKDAGILIDRQSPWNTPLLPIKKAGGEYRPIQDLRQSTMPLSHCTQ
jgi:hypothetical protein